MATQQQFTDLNENIRLTEAQREDAKTKYTGVCKTLHVHFYPDIEYNGDTKLLFGSYAKHTAIRPMTEDQDVDVLFKIPEETYQQYAAYQTGGQSALLQELRKVLTDSRYGLGEKPKAWGKVILVKTADGTHNIELLPAYEKEDGTFIIPNSENSGSWDIFDPREQLKRFRDSNTQTEGLTSDLSRMVKRWAREASSVSIKSFQLENFVIAFLASYDYGGKGYAQIVAAFFAYLLGIVDADNRSYVETAKGRADKALAFEAENKDEAATEEWKKVFGDSFPVAAEKIAIVSQEILPALADSSHCEVLRWPFVAERRVSINAYTYNPEKTVKLGGLNSNGRNLATGLSLKYVAETNAGGQFEYYWQVVNTGEHARSLGGLRGSIFSGQKIQWESTLYRGKHWIECFIIQSGQCIARSGKFFVNIK